tara:strand:- start:110 stop:472 length:363 start_codon:yes stop_codon:yes gene_type:complete
MNCQCNRCELGSVGHYTQWTCEYTGEVYHWTDDGVVEWCHHGTDGMVTARVTLQIVIDVPDGISKGTAVQQLIRNGMYDAFCVEILSSEPTNKSAKELTEKQSYINQLSKVNQEGSETND